MKIPRNLSATASASIGLVFLFLNPALGAESIYPDATTPAARGNDAPNWELGTIFRPDLAGKITHVRVFSLANESGDHQVRIWRNADSTLIAGPIPWAFGGDESWITLDIPDVSLEGNQDYTISISTAAGWYPANGGYFGAAGDNGQHLHYAVGAGVFSETAGDRPTSSFNDSAYLRDIVFEPDLNGPGIEVRGGNGKIADGAATVSFEDGTQFGGAKAGSGTMERTFTIANPGASNLQLTGNPKIVISGPQAAEFTVINQPTSPVPAGGSATFTVRFQPAASGLRDASVVITNSVTLGNPYDFAIEGIGIGSGNLIVGNPSDGNTTSAIDDHFIAGIRGLALRSMRITSIRAKVAELAGKFKCAVFSDRNGQPDHLLQGTAEVSSPTNGWQTFALAQPVDLGVGSNYWLVIWSDSPGARVYADAGGASLRGDYPYGEWPDTIQLAPTPNSLTFSLYAEGVPLDVTGAEMSVKSKNRPINDGSSNVSLAEGTDFGGADVKSGTRDVTFTISNVGKANQELADNPPVTITGAQAGEFTVVAPPASSIPPGGSTAFTIRFDPTGFGTRTATVSIARGDASGNPYDFVIQGTGLGGGAGILGNDGDGAYARNIDDAQIHGNRFQAQHNLRITELRAKVLELAGTFKCAVYSDNGGWADRLLATSVEVVNATNGWNSFTLSSPLNVTAGDYYWLVIWSDTVGARVQADSAGTAYYGIYAYLDAGGQFPDRVSLIESSHFLDPAARTYCIYAEGTPIGAGPGAELDLKGSAKLIVSGDTTPSAQDGTDFGSLDTSGTKQDRTFTIENRGDANLTAPSSPVVTVTGSAAADFSVASQPTLPIVPGASATFIVRFDPSSTGVRAATINIASNDGDENPFSFAVQGAGIATGLETIWPDTKVGRDIDFDGTAYELGTIFRSSAAGKITRLRVYSLTSESGDHIARIWRNDDEIIIGGPYTWNYGGTTGWITLDIPDVAIDAETDYTVSVSTGKSAKRNYPNIAADVGARGGNGQHLSYPANAGVFSDVLGNRPVSSFNGGNYLRDVVFVAAGAGGTPVRIVEIKPDLTAGNITLRWEGDGPRFQVEKATSVSGPFQSVGAAQSALVFTDAGTLKTSGQVFYRVRQISTP